MIEATRCGAGASSRNGGFLNYSLTHGIENGRGRFPDEIGAIERLGMSNYEELCADLGRYEIDAELEPTGELDVAVAPHQVSELEESARALREFGQRAELLDADAIKAEVNSPLYLAGLWQQTGAAIVNPAKLADGLRVASLAAGVQIFEHSRVRRLQQQGDGVEAITDAGIVRAAKALLATSAYEPLVPAVRRYIAPVYDYALMTEPLSEAQLASIGWKRRQGIGDSGYQFHYYRLSADNRILWGGYDAVYRYGGPVGPELDDDERDLRAPVTQLLHELPATRGHPLHASLGWGDRHLQPLLGLLRPRARRPRLPTRSATPGSAWAPAASAGARRSTCSTVAQPMPPALEFVRRRPAPFPPEPLRSAAIQFTRNRLAAADRSGQRGIWLRTLDRARSRVRQLINGPRSEERLSSEE